MSATTTELGFTQGSRSSLTGLRRFNLVVGLVHLVQAVLMLVLSNGFTLPITRTFLNGPPGTVPVTTTFLDVRLGPAVAIFLFLAAFDHLLMAAPGINERYNRMLGERRNDFRWIEYSISASLMIVLISMICGVSDFGALLAIAGVNACMLFFGLLMERYNRTTGSERDWLPYVYGCIAGAVPWVIIAFEIGFSIELSKNSIPGFVYGIILSLFIFFNSFAVNMVLQYRQTGRWRDYLYGEKAYIVLSLIAKSALAWQVFANILVK
ncbi:MAG: heliorhodopsin HeR [Opitutaceae bacterium]